MRINWKLTIFSVFFLLLFLRLGFWQIDRSYEKEALIKEDKIRRAQSGVPITGLPEALSQLDGQPIKLTGYFMAEQTVLLDNVVLKGNVGFEVMVPFHDTASGLNVLVNRGFVQMGRTRSDAPVVPPLLIGEQTIEGNVYVTKRVNEKTETMDFADNQLRIVLSKDPLALGGLLGSNVFNHLVRLSEQDPNALPRYWPLVTMKPEKHFGYAITWFCMAIAVALSFAAFMYQTNREKPNE